MTTDKPMLTKREVEEFNSITREHLGRDSQFCNTIERAVELLEEMRGDRCPYRECRDGHIECKLCSFLAAYHGTGTEKEGGGR